LIELVEPAGELGDQIGPHRWDRLFWLAHSDTGTGASGGAATP
jgi:hypothetical protein